MFHSPVFVLSSMLATLWAALFHLLFGKKLTHLIQYWFVGLIGFYVGHAMADALGFSWQMVGRVHFIEGTAVCWVAMLVVRWLKV